MSTVAIIMPAYRAQNTILSSIDSVINQTFKNWKLYIIIPSKDSLTENAVRPVIDKRHDIELITQRAEHGEGVSVARNLGIMSSDSKYIAFLDADDMWLPEKLSKQVGMLEENKLDFVGTNCIYFKNNRYYQYSLFFKKITYTNLLVCNWIVLSSVLIRRDILNEAPFYNLGHEDYFLWLCLLKNGRRAEVLNQSLTIYRVLPGSLSSNWLEIPEKMCKIYALLRIPVILRGPLFVVYFLITFFKKLCIYLRSTDA